MTPLSVKDIHERRLENASARAEGKLIEEVSTEAVSAPSRSARPALTLRLGLVLCLCGSAVSGTAQEAPDGTSGKSAEEVARELSNPNATLGQMGFPIDYIQYGGDLPGAGDESAFRISFQPSLPVPLGPGFNFFARPLVSMIVRQPLPAAEGGFENSGVQFGDVGFDTALGKTFSNGMLALGGMVGSAPTASLDGLGRGHWTLGPEAAFGVVKAWGAALVLLTHSWNVGGTRTNVTAGQYFYVINLSGGWQIAAQPTFAFDHEAPEGSRFTFPIGTGISKTSILGETPFKFAAQYWYFVARPGAFGPRHQVRFQVTAVVPLPW